MKKIKLIFFLIFIFWGVFFLLNNKDKIVDYFKRAKEKFPEVKEKISEPVKKSVVLKKIIEEKVSQPPPLKAKKDFPEAFLTKEGVIKFTNAQREKYGLLPLKENEKLNLSAKIKVEDMFANQYFSHYSPEGKGINDLAKEAGYEFILVGENLALGNFLDDETLVNGWMESPGHRENILNPRYQEIGVFVKKGIFEGKETWLAVQHFGLPLSSCPLVDENLKREIEEKEKEAEEMIKTLNSLLAEIRTIRPKRSEDYRKKVEEYNNLLSNYQNLVNELNTKVENYNLQVENFNKCVGEE